MKHSETVGNPHFNHQSQSTTIFWVIPTTQTPMTRLRTESDGSRSAARASEPRSSVEDFRHQKMRFFWEYQPRTIWDIVLFRTTLEVDNPIVYCWEDREHGSWQFLSADHLISQLTVSKTIDPEFVRLHSWQPNGWDRSGTRCMTCVKLLGWGWKGRMVRP